MIMFVRWRFQHAATMEIATPRIICFILFQKNFDSNSIGPQEQLKFKGEIEWMSQSYKCASSLKKCKVMKKIGI